MMNKKTLFALLVSLMAIPAMGLIKESDRQTISVPRNLLSNPGAENGLAGWEGTGSSSLTLDTSTPLDGNASFVWDPSASGEFFRPKNLTIPVPEGLKGKWCSVEMEYKWSGGTFDEIRLEAHDGTNLLSYTSLNPTQSSPPSLPEAAFFTCPLSGNVHFRLESFADAAAITVDALYLSSPTRQKDQANAEVAFSGGYDATGSCVWSRTNTANGAFGTTAACPAITTDISAPGVIVDSSDDDLPTLVFTSLPPGDYNLVWRFIGVIASAGQNATWVLRDTTNSADLDYTGGSSWGANENQSMVLMATFTQTVDGPRAFELYGSAASGAVNVSATTASSFASDNKITLTRYPTGSHKSVSFDKANWFVDANIGGGNIDLGSSTQASLIAPNNSTLTLVKNSGSAPVGISCSSTNDNAIGDTTCSSGNEEAGIVFEPPYAGEAEVCYQFTHYINTNLSTDDITVNWRIVNTDNGSQTVPGDSSRVGQAMVASGHENFTESSMKPVHLCSKLKFLSAQKQTVRLMYTQVINGTPDFNIITYLSSQREVNVTVRMLSQSRGGINFDNSVSTSNKDGLRSNIAEINCDVGSSILQNPGGWIDSVSNISSGDCSVTFTAGVFANDPICQITGTPGGVSVSMSFSSTGATTSGVSSVCNVLGGADCTAIDYYLTCDEPK